MSNVFHNVVNSFYYSVRGFLQILKYYFRLFLDVWGWIVTKFSLLSISQMFLTVCRYNKVVKFFPKVCLFCYLKICYGT